MSLVREALAKAEREAAARAAREKGLPPALADAAQPYRAPRRPRWPWAAALAAATLAGAGAAYLLLGSRDPGASVAPAEPAPGAERANRGRIPGQETAPRTEAPSRPQEPFPTGGRGSTDDADPGDGSPPPTAAPAEPSQTAAPAEPAPGAERASQDRIPDKETAPRTEAPSRPQEPFPAGGRGRDGNADSGAGSPPSTAAGSTLAGSYVKEFALDAGKTIRLGGIAWSEAAPLAYLNGKLRGVGEIVEGWRVAAIERERVILENGRLRVQVSLR